MSFSLEDEKQFAHDVVFMKDVPEFLKWTLMGHYNEFSFIFRVTNERINTKEYIETIKDKRKILSVIASGDQILNSILFGSKDIDGYDISIFPKYYLMLKLAAVESLNLNDFKEFFYGKKALNKDMYKVVSKKLDPVNKEFWDNIINKNNSRKSIATSDLFCTDQSCINDASINNPFMDEENYKELKSKIKNINLRLMNGSIYDLRDGLKSKYDLVNLSSIMVSDLVIPPSFDKQKEFFKGFNLNKNGEVLSYIYDYDFDSDIEGWEKLPDEDDFKFKKLTSDNGKEEDAILVYKKLK